MLKVDIQRWEIHLDQNEAKLRLKLNACYAELLFVEVKLLELEADAHFRNDICKSLSEPRIILIDANCAQLDVIIFGRLRLIRLIWVGVPGLVEDVLIVFLYDSEEDLGGFAALQALKAIINVIEPSFKLLRHLLRVHYLHQPRQLHILTARLDDKLNIVNLKFESRLCCRDKCKLSICLTVPVVPLFLKHLS